MCAPTKAAAIRLLVWANCAAVLAILPLARADEPAHTGPQTEARFPPLAVPAGFKATLFACDPLIEYPSAIAIGPRPGAIFVAVDYMTGLGTEIVRRSEVRLVKDTNGDGYADQAPVFAGGFNSIQGMTWHDGTLFVMHAPFLTALSDPDHKGVATGRSDLLEGLGLTPEENPVRLHCANGVVAGHDGWLYLALGDHGCDVKRPEGDRLVFQGGGILRCRPDGRDLHVFATGLRNIYDVALDEDLNVFVRDNENDGGTYKIRVCYSFHGADHGYPYLYEDRQNEAMPPLADLGLGSSAGGACYLEWQFPKDYRGNLLFCEWGKSVVRYPLLPRGSGFEPPAEHEFAAGAKEDTYGFKPTDLVVQRDGTVMVSDYADGQRPKRGRGRIYHFAYVGESGSARTDQKSAASRDESDKCLTQLDSESYFERCDAQKALASGGRAGLKKLTDALAQQRLGVRGRLHAVWIVAGAREPSAFDDLLKLAETDPEPRVRAQAVRAIADLADPVMVHHRLDAPPSDATLAARLAAIAKGQDVKVLLEVCVALGRLRWADTAEWLKENFARADAPLAHAAMQALRRSGNWPAAVKLLDLLDSHTLRAVALAAVAERYEPVVVDGLIERLQSEASASRRQEYADLLTRVCKQPGPWTYWGYRPLPKPANTVAWERTDVIASALDRALATFEPPARLALLRRTEREQIPVPPETLTKWLETERDVDRVAAILAALATHPAAVIRRHLVSVVRNSEHSPANRQAALAQFSERLDEPAAEQLLDLSRALEDGPVLAGALRRLARYPKLAAAPLLATKLSSSEPEVRAAAIETLGELRAEVDPSALLTHLADADARVRRSAAVASGKLMAKEASEPLLKLATDGDPAVRRASFDALRLLKETRAVPLAVAALSDWQVNSNALQCIAEIGGPAQADALAEFAKHSPSADVVATTIRALAKWRSRPETPAAAADELGRSVAEIQGTTGIVVHWETGGPLPADFALLKERLPVSERRTLFAIGAEGRLALASKNVSPDGAWLAHSLLSAAEPTDVEFLASSSGSLRVWLNGKSVYERAEPQSFRIDSDRFSATLANGDNRLAVMVASSSAPAEFHLRLRRKSATAQHERLIQAALARPGNVERGRQTFLNVEKSQCLKCHRVGEQGERTGPELTGIGTRFSRIYIVESILEPSRTIAPSFGTLTVLLNDGRTLSGVKAAETQAEFTLVDNQGQKHLLRKSDIEEQKPSAQSTMPEGLEKRLTDQEFVDLIAYFASLKESRAP